MEKTVVELFAGVGGFRVGLNDIHSFDENGVAIENSGWNFVWANQWEPSTKTQHAFECYKKRFNVEETNNENHAEFWSNKDVSTVPLSVIPNHSLLVGGFPCQDYSVARSLSGEKGIEGKKGVLFWEISRILKGKNTPFVLLENVDRLLKSPAKQRGRDFGIMLRTFNDLGYNVEWRVINAAEYGCAQRRRRVFIFAWRKDLRYNALADEEVSSILYEKGLFARTFPIEHIAKDGKVFRKTNLTEYADRVEMTDSFSFQFGNTGVMLDGDVSTFDSLPIKEYAITLRQIREDRKDLEEFYLKTEQEDKFRVLRGSKKVERVRPNGEKYYYSEGSMAFPDALDLPGRTMLTSEGSINRSTHIIEDLQTGNLRFITPIEAERMQSFPDDWTNTGMPKNRRYFMMGNALVTKIINKLELNLRSIIENED
ncbi:MAG: DNA (cytosine-5-)-methyltransferase [Erysipelotrichaceae bacterium]|nr:DNA (cytosine-5-)-methyltransferase [Erysipelotrichaceae bacterium]